MVPWHDCMKVSHQNNSLGDFPHVGHRRTLDFWLLRVHCWHLGLTTHPSVLTMVPPLIYSFWGWWWWWRVSFTCVYSLLAPHSLHRLHATNQEVLHRWLLLSHLRAFTMTAPTGPFDPCPFLFPPMWWHCAFMGHYWAGKKTGIVCGMVFMPFLAPSLYFLFVAGYRRQEHNSHRQITFWECHGDSISRSRENMGKRYIVLS